MVYFYNDNSRVSIQNGISLLYITLLMHHSGWKPSNCNTDDDDDSNNNNMVIIILMIMIKMMIMNNDGSHSNNLIIYIYIFFFFFFFFFCVPLLYLCGSPLLGEIFAYVTVF